ncbi:MAG: hypothetical protein QOH54_5380, partial [Mycobacterium sp.]|nr:hypothetical protein [Mycobacterium sp.]
MRKRTETRLVDRMISAYVNWREASRLVHDAYLVSRLVEACHKDHSPFDGGRAKG